MTLSKIDFVNSIIKSSKLFLLAGFLIKFTNDSFDIFSAIFFNLSGPYPLKLSLMEKVGVNVKLFNKSEGIKKLSVAKLIIIPLKLLVLISST